MKIEVQERLAALQNLIGNTPLLEIGLRYRGRPKTLYAKAEYYNLTGSVKDRVALHVLWEAYKKGAIRPGDLIAEATSGNTGISFAALGAALGNPVQIFMPDYMSVERKNILKGYGAKLCEVSREEGGFPGCIKKCKELGAKNPRVFLPEQFENEDNARAHYLTTGAEIAAQLQAFGKKPDAAVAGVGTGGTIMGIGKRLREANPGVKVYPLEPMNSPTLSTGHRVGKHRIQGISDEFIPDLLKLDQLDEVVAVDDGDAIVMAQMLAKKFGLGLGISSGANLLGALLASEKLGGDPAVVTVFADDSKKYLSTDLAREEPVKDGYLTAEIELTTLRAAR